MQQPDLNILQSGQEGDTLKVEQVRDLQHQLSLAPYESSYRIALLLRFEEANANAQNALLKTLEEPNPRVVLLVTADDPEKPAAEPLLRAANCCGCAPCRWMPWLWNCRHAGRWTRSARS